MALARRPQVSVRICQASQAGLGGRYRYDYLLWSYSSFQLKCFAYESMIGEICLQMMLELSVLTI